MTWTAHARHDADALPQDGGEHDMVEGELDVAHAAQQIATLISALSPYC